MKKQFSYFSGFLISSVPAYFLFGAVDKIAPLGTKKSVIMRVAVLGLWVAGGIYVGKQIEKKYNKQ